MLHTVYCTRQCVLFIVDGMIGMAVAGGAAAAVGVGIVALIGAAIAGSKR